MTIKITKAEELQANLTLVVQDNNAVIALHDGTSYSFTCPNNLSVTTLLTLQRANESIQQLQIRDCTQAITENIQIIKDRLHIIETFNTTQYISQLEQTKTACDQLNQKQDISVIATSLTDCRDQLIKAKEGKIGWTIGGAIGALFISWLWKNRGKEELPR